MGHFQDRCKERGVKADPEALLQELRLAWRSYRDEYLEAVFRNNKKSKNDGLIYRFMIQGEGVFYCVINEYGHVKTLLTQDQIKAMKLAKKKGVRLMTVVKEKQLESYSQAPIRKIRRLQ